MTPRASRPRNSGITWSSDNVTFLSCVPSYLASVLAEIPQSARLTHLALGGEAFSTEFHRAVLQRLDVANVTNLYGPTEATIDAISYAVAGDQPAAHIPIGRAASPITGSTSWTQALSRFRSGLPVSCT